MNNKGQSTLQNVILFSLILVGIMAFGLVMTVTGTVVKMTTEKVIPGVIGVGSTTDLNVGGKADDAANILEQGANLMPMLMGIIYLLSILGTFGLAFAFRMQGDKYLLVLYFLLSIIVIFASILVSNIYQNFYESGGLFGNELQEATLLSWLMLYSPLIFVIITFIGATLMFSGIGEEGQIA